MDEIQQTTTGIPDTFLEEVKQILEKLYDFPYLQNHPLATQLLTDAESLNETQGQRLRRIFIAAIETLNPGDSVSFRSHHARLYNLLHLHYVEGLTIQEAAHELGVSVRQAYRDLKRGQDSVAAVVWSNQQQYPSGSHTVLTPSHQPTTEISSVQSEVERLPSAFQTINLNQLFDAGLRAVEKLAQKHQISFEIIAPPAPFIFATNAVIAQQVLTHILSQAIRQAEIGTLQVYLDPLKTQLRLIYRPKPETPFTLNDVMLTLSQHLGWRLQTDNQPTHTEITIHLETQGPVVLIIDDNVGLVDLLNRYLSGHMCQVLSANSGQQGLELALKSHPDAIILDVMMPGMDGWELLQRLRAQAETETTPIIICSVFNDPELAYSLGATLFVPKPVSRDAILTALHQCGVV